MHRAALFDAGDTLIHWNVHKRERFGWLCDLADIPLPDDPELRLRAARAADRFFYSQLGRADSWSEAWWIEQAAAGLVEVGLSGDLAAKIAAVRRGLKNQWILDREAIPVLEELRRRGYKIGLVSNWDGTLAATCGELGLSPLVDFIGDSQVFGQTKPAPAFFLHVLEQLEVAPEAAFHVGDDYDTDVEGARAAGIVPVLIDILGCHDRACDYRVAGLHDVLEVCDRVHADNDVHAAVLRDVLQ